MNLVSREFAEASELPLELPESVAPDAKAVVV